MKFLALLLLLASLGSHASTVANCRLVDGLYENSKARIEDLSFETYADIFTLTNANTLSFSIKNERLRLVRTELKVDRYSELVYVQKKNQEIVRSIHITLDGTPRAIGLYRHFYGYLLISPEDSPGTYVGKGVLNYNFYCQF